MSLLSPRLQINVSPPEPPKIELSVKVATFLQPIIVDNSAPHRALRLSVLFLPFLIVIEFAPPVRILLP